MTTKRTLTAALTLLGVALTTTACNLDDGNRMVAMCADRYGNFLPDYECDSGGLYPNAFPYFMPYSTWREETVVHHHHYYSGDRLTGGSTTPPRHARVESPSRPGRVTVYDAGKRTVTTNKQANSFGTVTKRTKTTNTYHAPKKASWGSYKPAKKSGKCC